MKRLIDDPAFNNIQHYKDTSSNIFNRQAFVVTVKASIVLAGNNERMIPVCRDTDISEKMAVCGHCQTH